MYKTIFGWITILAIGICLNTNGLYADSIKPQKLPLNQVIGPDNVKVKGLAELGTFKEGLPLWADLSGAEALIKFSKPVKLPAIAILKTGWSDWSVPRTVSISINNNKEATYILKSLKNSPSLKNKTASCDIIPIKESLVKTIFIKVTGIEKSKNKHGSFKVLIPDSQATRIVMPEKLPTHASGIKLILNCRKPSSQIIIKAVAYRFRRQIHWTAPLQSLSAGKNEVVIPWTDFFSNEYPNVNIQPVNLHNIQLITADKSAPPEVEKWKFVMDSNADNIPAWKKIPAISYKPDNSNWRPGIPISGFGRFGYVPNNGLLVGSISPNRFAYEIQLPELKKTLNLTISCGNKNEMIWQRHKANWTGVNVSRKMRAGNDSDTAPKSKAFGVYNKKNLPQTWIYSILAPGFLVKSSDKSLSVTAGDNSGVPWILYPAKEKYVWSKLDKPISGQMLTEGWCAIVWEDNPEQPILLCLQHRPLKISNNRKSVNIDFSEPMGYVGIGVPAGYRGWLGIVGKSDSSTTELVKKCRLLSSILRAYPRTSAMSFREERGKVRFKETFNYVCWQNDWHEDWLKTAPVSPLLVFAKQNGYKVEWNKNEPENTGIDTKYGPYCVWTGKDSSFSGYTLPVPPTDTTLYLRPAKNKLADTVAERITGKLKRSTEPGRLKIDSLFSWWMYAPASLGWPLLSDSQMKLVASAWRSKLKKTLLPRAWYLRTEPYSGTKYMLSFSWIDRSREIMGDPNSGIGAMLYAGWSYARSTGDWNLINDNWEIFRAAIRYFLVCHDWAQMQTGSREHTASSSIDMDGISYEGTLAFFKMAEALNKKNDAAMAKMLLSRLALSNVTKWWGTKWVHPELKARQWRALGAGFSEFKGFDLLSARRGGPCHANSELALSLSWVGQYPVFYDLLRWGNGNKFWNYVEFDYLENKIQDWRKKHKGTRNNHDANICAHLYMQANLHHNIRRIDKELNLQVYGNGRKWFFKPDPRLACENAAMYALYLGYDFPVRIKDWGKSIITKAEYDTGKQEAKITIISSTKDTLKLELLKPALCSINGSPPRLVTAGACIFYLKNGINNLTLSFNKK